MLRACLHCLSRCNGEIGAVAVQQEKNSIALCAMRKLYTVLHGGWFCPARSENLFHILEQNKLLNMAKITFQHNIKISSNKVQRDESLPAKKYEIFGKTKKRFTNVLFYFIKTCWLEPIRMFTIKWQIE